MGAYHAAKGYSTDNHSCFLFLINQNLYRYLFQVLANFWRFLQLPQNLKRFKGLSRQMLGVFLACMDKSGLEKEPLLISRRIGTIFYKI